MNLMDNAFNQRKQERERAAQNISDSQKIATSMESDSSTREATRPSRKDLAEAGLKWGVRPKDEPAPYVKPESEYTPEEQAKRERLRQKGVNPDLKAEMDAKVFGKGVAPDGTRGSKKGGFWAKVAGTAFGGGSIK